MPDTAGRRWVQRNAWITDENSSSNEPVRINYIECTPAETETLIGTLVLLHGFPQTSYQYRHVVGPFSEAGYRVVAPDYRGAGGSSKPRAGFTKSIMARDIFRLVHDHLGIHTKVHVVGHDIGAMIAHAYATRYPECVASVVWGECPLPGTTAYENDKRDPAQFHFVFHAVADLPEALVAGREEVYLRHFFDKNSLGTDAISQEDLKRYVADYAQPGAMRCAFEVYRAFEVDARENREWREAHGKCKTPTLGLHAEMFRHAQEAPGMLDEMYEAYKAVVVEQCGHYIAEERPEDFVALVLDFVTKHT